MFAGGCFWGVQGVFQHVDGREERGLGLCRRRGGDGALPGGRAAARTGHAEAVAGDLRPATRSATARSCRSTSRWRTTRRSSTGRGRIPAPQYRSTIFPQDDGAGEGGARPTSTSSTRPGCSTAPIVTTIEPGRAFYPAEDYHQDYLTLNPTQPYIVYNDLPKIENLKRLFPAV